jgi:UDP-glucose 4-epimerase
LRQFNIYGPGQNPSFLIASVIQQIKEKDEISLGNTSTKRDYTYIDDLSKCYSILLEKDMPNLSVLNIGSGENHSVKEIVDIVSSVLRKKVKITTDETKVRANDLDEVAGIEKIKGLGWKPSVKIKDGLKKTTLS